MRNLRALNPPSRTILHTNEHDLPYPDLRSNAAHKPLAPSGLCSLSPDRSRIDHDDLILSTPPDLTHSQISRGDHGFREAIALQDLSTSVADLPELQSSPRSAKRRSQTNPSIRKTSDPQYSARKTALANLRSAKWRRSKLASSRRNQSHSRRSHSFDQVAGTTDLPAGETLELILVGTTGWDHRTPVKRDPRTLSRRN